MPIVCTSPAKSCQIQIASYVPGLKLLIALPDGVLTSPNVSTGFLPLAGMILNATGNGFGMSVWSGPARAA